MPPIGSPASDIGESTEKPLSIAVIINVRSGAARAETEHRIAHLFAASGVKVQFIEVAEDLTSAAKTALAGTFSAVIAAGGDGTVNAVARALTDTLTPLGTLPIGTLNHFARDIGLPAKLSEAVAANVKALRENRIRCVDVGEVNGRVFLNNSSIGIYPRLLRRRDKLRARLAVNKWMAMLFALIAALRRYPELDVSLDLMAGDGPLHRRTPFVFVGNNRYALHLLALGERKHLDRGEMCVYVAHRPGRFGTIKLLLLALFRRLKQARDFNAYLVPQVTVNTPKRRLAVAIDGEVEHLRPPLHYRIRPKCLRILAP